MRILSTNIQINFLSFLDFLFEFHPFRIQNAYELSVCVLLHADHLNALVFSWVEIEHNVSMLVNPLRFRFSVLPKLQKKRSLDTDFIDTQKIRKLSSFSIVSVLNVSVPFGTPCIRPEIDACQRLKHLWTIGHEPCQDTLIFGGTDHTY